MIFLLHRNRVVAWLLRRPKTKVHHVHTFIYVFEQHGRYFRRYSNDSCISLCAPTLTPPVFSAIVFACTSSAVEKWVNN